MLQYQTVEQSTLGLLKNILQQPVFKNHRLVGGTSLALQYGHRLSIDLDFFTSEFIEHEEILINIKSIGKVDVVSKSKYISCFFINDVKVDFVSLPYHWIDDPIIEDSISLASINDIAAMKLSAITNRGSKKDFIDLQLIMKHLDLKKMMSLYHQKYPDGMEMLVLRSLMYFDDADLQPDPVMLTEYDWNEVKAFILDQVKTYIGG
jgi:predicted nucleotidyltransferase component of viral defense system